MGNKKIENLLSYFLMIQRDALLFIAQKKYFFFFSGLQHNKSQVFHLKSAAFFGFISKKTRKTPVCPLFRVPGTA